MHSLRKRIKSKRQKELMHSNMYFHSENSQSFVHSYMYFFFQKEQNQNK